MYVYQKLICIYTYTDKINSNMHVYKAPRFSIESKGFTEDQDKEKDKDSQDH